VDLYIHYTIRLHGVEHRDSFTFTYTYLRTASVVKWSEFLASNTGVTGVARCFLSSSGSGTGSAEPREQFDELLGRNSSGSRSRKSKLRSEGLVALTT
jgi:hypothetical protein